MGNYDALFSPIKIGGVTLKNRVILTAMGGTSFFIGDRFNEKIRDYYIDRCKGNVGCIIPGVTQVKNGKHFLYEQEDIFLGPIKDLVEEIHSYGTKYFMQLGAGFGRVQLFGMFATDEETRKALMVAPSDGLENRWDPSIKHRGLTKEEIQEIIVAFGKTAKLCQQAGIDGVELHAVHEGYLLDQFAVANTNYRDDEYGGSLENRLRFTTEIIKEIKRVCGKDFPVSVRYSVASKMRGFNQGALPAENYKEFGRNLEESPQAARILQEAGCDLLNADNGSYDSWWWAHPPVYMPLHSNFPEVAYLKNFVDIPVFCAGRMEDPDFANRVIEAGQIDGIGVARQFLADPFWLNKVQEGKLDEIRPCIACHNGCFPIGKIPVNDGRDFMMSHCALRPNTMAEQKWELKVADVSKKIAVVGGGIAGMEAARVCTLRGHKVTLFEKSNELGGVFIAAAAPVFKEKDKMLLKWYARQMELLNIDVRLNTEADMEMLKEYNEIILATGASPRKLNVEGIDNDNVVEAIQYLRGSKSVGDNVVIIGGGLTGIEIAYQLALDKKKPTVVEMQKDILQVAGLCAANSDMLREVIRVYNIDVHTESKLVSVEKDGVVVEENGEHKKINCDSVILSVGYVANTQLEDKLKENGFENVHVIGDERRVSNLMNAVYDAYKVGYTL